MKNNNKVLTLVEEGKISTEQAGKLIQRPKEKTSWAAAAAIVGGAVAIGAFALLSQERK